MKKLTAILVALMLVAMTAVTAFAAGINTAEKAVLDELNTSVTMQGTEMSIPAEYVNQAENYFNTIEMTAEQSSQIIAIIKSGKSFLANSGASNIAGLTYAQKEQLLGYGQQAVGVLGMTMSFDKASKTLTIYAPDGSVAFTAVPTLVSGSGSGSGTPASGKPAGTVVNGDTIKTTGAGFDFGGVAVVGAVAVLLMAGGALYLAKSKKERV